MAYTPNDLMLKARQKFISDNGDLLALVKNLTVDELCTKMAAAMQLNPSYTEEILLHADSEYLNQIGHAGRAAREAFQAAAYRAICQSFLKVERNLHLLFSVSGNDFPEAAVQLNAILIAAGEKEAPIPAPPPKSAQELLVEQVKEDWAKLETSKFRAKMQRDSAYRAVAERLLAGDDLPTQATTLVDGSRGFNR